MLNRKFIIMFIFIEFLCLIKGKDVCDCCDSLKKNMLYELNSLKKEIYNLKNEIKTLNEKINELTNKEEEPIDIDLDIAIDSLIINDESEKKLLINRIKEIDFLKNSKFEFNLLYRGTRDGTWAYTLHEKCDDYSNTISIVKSDSGARFGGYMTNAYSSLKDDWVLDDFDSFVFSLDLMKIYNATKKENFKYYLGKNDGPCFNAFCIGDISELNSDEYKTFGEASLAITNKPSEYYSGLADNKYELNLGKNNYKVKEIEIFQVVKK